MPPITKNGKNLWATVNDTEAFVDWIHTNLSVSDFITDIPDIVPILKEEYGDISDGLDLMDEEESDYDAPSVAQVLATPGVWELVSDEYNNQYIAAMEEEFEDTYHELGIYTLHGSDTSDPDDSYVEACGWSRNAESLIDIGKKKFAAGRLHNYFIYDSSGELYGEVGLDDNDNFVVWSR